MEDRIQLVVENSPQAGKKTVNIQVALPSHAFSTEKSDKEMYVSVEGFFLDADPGARLALLSPGVSGFFDPSEANPPIMAFNSDRSFSPEYKLAAKPRALEFAVTPAGADPADASWTLANIFVKIAFREK